MLEAENEEMPLKIEEAISQGLTETTGSWTGRKWILPSKPPERSRPADALLLVKGVEGLQATGSVSLEGTVGPTPSSFVSQPGGEQICSTTYSCSDVSPQDQRQWGQLILDRNL